LKFNLRSAAVFVFSFALLGGTLFAQQLNGPVPPQQSQAKPSFETDSPEQYKALVEAIRAHSYPISIIKNKLIGPGADFLRVKAAKAQFMLIGEEHNVAEIPEFTSVLFFLLHECCGFNHLALESDPLSAQIASSSSMKGQVRKIDEYAAKFPNAFTFATDQELQMIADACNISTAKTDCVWGLDQSFGALHALEDLRTLSDVNSGSEMFQMLLSQSREYDARRFRPGKHYMSNIAKPADFEQLQREMKPAPGSDADFILSNLVSSTRIFTNFFNNTPGRSTRYISGHEREEQMKKLFMRNYHNAQNAGEAEPKALLKLGHWHVFRGLAPTGLQTLGNFVTEFATANGHEAFDLAVFIHGSPGEWREIGKWPGMKPFAMAAGSKGWTLIDFEPLRAAAIGGDFGTLNSNLRSYIFGFDAALVMGNASPASYHVADPDHTE
jgi:hypothetical protein